jgi:polar amino acid transport system substrate-binding protein
VPPPTNRRPRAAPRPPSEEACPQGALDTKTAGKLTVATDNPAYEPWVVDNKPENGKGFESAVAYQVAQRLGYPAANVVWTRVPFNNAIAPGPKTFDMDLNQFSITAERKQAVDFSSPYYLVRQTVITIKGSPIAGATSIAS